MLKLWFRKKRLLVVVGAGTEVCKLEYRYYLIAVKKYVMPKPKEGYFFTA